ncbi:MAG: ABC transporter permease [Sulfurovum sp.]|nr:ABC transporter permease [Sulfurovum sp.]
MFCCTKGTFLREFNMRLTQSRSGLFWTFFEPFYQVAFFIIIKVVIFGTVSDNYDYTVFLAIAFTPFIMFRNIITKSLGAFTANKNLFIYKQVKPIDTIIARVLIEIFITSIVILLFTTIALYFNFDTNVQHLGILAFAYIWIIIFAFGLSILLAVLNSYTTIVESIISMLLTPLLFLSAIFYTVDTLSTELRDLLLFNPLTHFMEMIHAAYFYTLEDTYVNYTYITFWTILPLHVGLWFYIKLEKRIISL